ncbi:hypothetical protein AB0H29_08275 [Streptomyces thermolilacinus]
MDAREVIRLLGEISLIDDRVVKSDEAEQKAQVRLWAVALRDVPLEFAGEAVGRHYAESAWPIMPKDITARWRTTARDRMERHAERRAPAVDPDDVDAYVHAVRTGRRAVVTGAEPPAPIRALLAGVGRPVHEERTEPGPDYLAAKAQMLPHRPPTRPELAVRCTGCGADPGRPCRTLDGRLKLSGTHASRRDAYAARQAQGASA